jgi:predicted dehydrogenase
MTPPPTHASLTIQALEAGCQVFVAKSLCLTLADGEAMIRARDAATKHVEVGFQTHYAPIYRHVQERLGTPAFGELRGAWIHEFQPSHWREPGNWQNRIETLGGTLLDCCVHRLDVILYLLGKPWRRVFATGRQFLPGPPERDTVDDATVLVDLEGGVRVVMLFFDSHAYCYCRTGIVGSNGKFEIEHWEPNGAGHVRFHGHVKSKDPVRIYVPPEDACKGHIGIVDQSLHFLDVCRRRAESLSTLESAMETLAVQHAIVASLRQERWVVREEITPHRWR